MTAPQSMNPAQEVHPTMALGPGREQLTTYVDCTLGDVLRERARAAKRSLAAEIANTLHAAYLNSPTNGEAARDGGSTEDRAGRARNAVKA
jgi:hypothetical protein